MLNGLQMTPTTLSWAIEQFPWNEIFVFGIRDTKYEDFGLLFSKRKIEFNVEFVL